MLHMRGLLLRLHINWAQTMERTKTFKIALGGICLALTLIFMFGASFVPGIELTLFAIASLFTAVMIIETGVGGGIMLYIGAALLGLILLPNKLAMVPYIFFFGYWCIVKYFIEKTKSSVVQIIIKVIFFAALLCVALLFFAEVLTGSINLPDYPAAVLIAAGTLFLFLYDCIVTFLISFYFRRLQK